MHDKYLKTFWQIAETSQNLLNTVSVKNQIQGKTNFKYYRLMIFLGFLILNSYKNLFKTILGYIENIKTDKKSLWFVYLRATRMAYERKISKVHSLKYLLNASWN